MASSRSIRLGDHFEDYIASQVETGRYGSASELIRPALGLLETTECKQEIVRTALIAGERSGRAEYSYESLVSELGPEKY